MARYCDPDANAQNGERFAEQSMLNTPLPRLSTDSIGGLSSPTVNWNHTRLRLQKPRVLRGERLFEQEGYATGGYTSTPENRQQQHVELERLDVGSVNRTIQIPASLRLPCTPVGAVPRGNTVDV